MQLLEAPRYLHRPTVVPEVPAHLPHDGGDGEGFEVRAGRHIKPVDGVEQPDPGDLNQVIACFSPSVEAVRDVVGQRQASADDAFALLGVRLGVLCQPVEQPEHVQYVSVFRRHCK